MEHNLPVWLYSFSYFTGDFDSVCPFTAMRYTLHALGLDVTEPWRPWTVNNEAGGYIQGYNCGLVFVTVRGAGHMVPAYQPERALVLISAFLNETLSPRYDM
ncbi:serine carboxypeptidase 1-like [Triticum urartu]|uniref:serine carboxypeptidase 1-like n=1 Tax=Triticum aestivum TaxID=4565 RepID=UPI001D0222EF|nr:serine carboxypeptidase 1-like [Triticum aestivum]XP_048527750.1 serine carboxypeptidase 1-like [Triticum urartu]